jgi:hypothetical protein
MPVPLTSRKTPWTRSSVDNLGAWLTTVVARVCLNVLRSRNTRRSPTPSAWPGSTWPAWPDRPQKISRWCAKRVRASGWLLGNPQATSTWMVWYPVAPLGSVRCTTAVWV